MKDRMDKTEEQLWKERRDELNSQEVDTKDPFVPAKIAEATPEEEIYIKVNLC